MKRVHFLLYVLAWLICNPLVHSHVHIYPQKGNVSYEDRVGNQPHVGGVFWLTGLSGAGKSTVASAVEKVLFDKGMKVVLLDGDTLRAGLNTDLGFTEKDRKENIRRTLEVAKLFENTGHIVICSLISPYRQERELMKAQTRNGHEVYIKASVETCIKRDPKGLYKKALKGDIKNFTGISSPYEVPSAPSLIIDTENLTQERAVESLIDFIIDKTQKKAS